MTNNRTLQGRYRDCVKAFNAISNNDELETRNECERACDLIDELGERMNESKLVELELLVDFCLSITTA